MSTLRSVYVPTYEAQMLKGIKSALNAAYPIQHTHEHNVPSHVLESVTSAFDQLADKQIEKVTALVQTIAQRVTDTITGIASSIAEQLLSLLFAVVACFKARDPVTCTLIISGWVAGTGCLSHISTRIVNFIKRVFTRAHVAQAFELGFVTDFITALCDLFLTKENKNREKDLKAIQTFSSTLGSFNTLFAFLNNFASILCKIPRFLGFTDTTEFDSCSADMYRIMSTISQLCAKDLAKDIATQTELRNSVKALLDECDSLLLRMSAAGFPNSDIVQFTKFRERLEIWRKNIIHRERVLTDRITPIWLHLYGPPGQGKSNLTHTVFSDLYESLRQHYAVEDAKTFERDFSADYSMADHVWTWNSSNEFADNYIGQWGVLGDDIYQNLTSEKTTEISEFLIKWVSTAPVAMHMATLEEKSGTFMTSRFIVTTDNGKFSNFPPHTAQIASGDAIRRRVTVALHVSVPERYTKVITDKNDQPVRVIDSSKLIDVDLRDVVEFRESDLANSPAISYQQVLERLFASYISTQRSDVARQSSTKKVYRAGRAHILATDPVPTSATELSRLLKQLYDVAAKQYPTAPLVKGNPQLFVAQLGRQVKHLQKLIKMSNLNEADKVTANAMAADEFYAGQDYYALSNDPLMMEHAAEYKAQGKDEYESADEEIPASLRAELKLTNLTVEDIIAKHKQDLEKVYQRPNGRFGEKLTYNFWNNPKKLLMEASLRCLKAAKTTASSVINFNREHPIIFGAAAFGGICLAGLAMYKLWNPYQEVVDDLVASHYSPQSAYPDERAQVRYRKAIAYKTAISKLRLGKPAHTAQGISENTVSCYELIKKNIVRIHYSNAKGEDPSISCVHGIFVGGRTLMTLSHFFEKMPTDKTHLLLKTPAGDFTVPVVDDQGLGLEADLAEPDLMLIHFTNKQLERSWKHVYHHFATPTELSGDLSQSVLFRPRNDNTWLGETCVAEYKSTTEHYNDGNIQYTLPEFIHVALPTFPGDCGLPYFVSNNQMPHKVIGIHVAGDRFIQSGLAHVIPKLEFNTTSQRVVFAQDTEYEKVNTFDAQAFQLVGAPGLQKVDTVAPSQAAHLPKGGEIHESVLARQIKAKYGLTRIPAIMRPYYDDKGIQHSPVQSGINKFKYAGRPVPIEEQELLKRIGEAVATQIPKTVARKLEWNEVVLAPAGFRNLKQVEMKTSPGYVPEIPTASKWDFICCADFQSAKRCPNADPHHVHRLQLRPQTLEALKMYESQLRVGCLIPRQFMTKGCPKIELRATEKAHVPRLFYPAHIMDLLMCRRYFGSFLESALSNPVDTFISVGINPQSPQWGLLWNKHHPSADGWMDFCGDFSGYDLSLKREQFILGRAALVRWHKLHTDYTEEDYVLIETLLEKIFYGNLIIDTCVFQQDGLNPSGWFLVTLWNCIVNMGCHIRVAIQEAKEAGIPNFTIEDYLSGFRFSAFGDDHLETTKNKWHTMENKSRLFKELFQMEYTTTSKQAVEKGMDYVRPDDVTYLKRHFTIVDGRMMGPLELKSIVEAPAWIRRESNMSENEILLSTANNAMSEFICYGKKAYEDYCLEITAMFARANLKQLPVTLPYEALVQRWETGKLGVWGMEIPNQIQETQNVAQSSQFKTNYIAQSKPDSYTTEQKDTSAKGVVSSLFETASSVANKLVPLGFFTKELTVASGVLNVVGRFARGAGFSRPQHINADTRVIVRPNEPIASTSGLSLTTPLGTDAENHVTTDPNNFGGAVDYNQFSNYKLKPGLFYAGSFDNTVAANALIQGFYINPLLCHQAANVRSPTPLRNMTEYAGWWTGSIKYTIYFFASKITNCSVRICHFPTSSSLPATIPDGGNIVSKVVNISGDTMINFTVPYVYQKGWAAVLDPLSSPGNGAVGAIGIYLINQMVTGDPTITPTVQMAFWISGGEDFRVAQIVRPVDPVTFNAQSQQEEVNSAVALSEVAVANTNSVRGLLAQTDVGPTHVTSEPQSALALPTDPYMLSDKFREPLGRQFRIATINWSSSDAIGTDLTSGTPISFPAMLDSKPLLTNILSKFRYYRAKGVKVEIVINSTMFHYGALLITWLPNYYLPATGSPNHMGNMYQASGNNSCVVSASVNNRVSFTIPWVSATRYYDRQTFGATEAGWFGSLKVWVLAPLRVATTTTATTVNISLFANFEDPVVDGPYDAQSQKEYDPQHVNELFRLPFESLIPSRAVATPGDCMGDEIGSWTQLLRRRVYWKTVTLTDGTVVACKFYSDLRTGALAERYILRALTSFIGGGRGGFNVVVYPEPFVRTDNTVQNGLSGHVIAMLGSPVGAPSAQDVLAAANGEEYSTNVRSGMLEVSVPFYSDVFYNNFAYAASTPQQVLYLTAQQLLDPTSGLPGYSEARVFWGAGPDFTVGYPAAPCIYQAQAMTEVEMLLHEDAVLPRNVFPGVRLTQRFKRELYQEGFPAPVAELIVSLMNIDHFEERFVSCMQVQRLYCLLKDLIYDPEFRGQYLIPNIANMCPYATSKVRSAYSKFLGTGTLDFKTFCEIIRLNKTPRAVDLDNAEWINNPSTRSTFNDTETKHFTTCLRPTVKYVSDCGVCKQIMKAQMAYFLFRTAIMQAESARLRAPQPHSGRLSALISEFTNEENRFIALKSEF